MTKIAIYKNFGKQLYIMYHHGELAYRDKTKKMTLNSQIARTKENPNIPNTFNILLGAANWKKKLSIVIKCNNHIL